jgi:uncharacterized protein (TIGR00251 family)
MTTSIPVRGTREGAKFNVRITPRASRTAITGLIGEGDDAVMKIALQAPPVDGRANDALIEFLSELLRTPRSTIEIAGGEHARNKIIRVRGRQAAEILPLLEKAVAAAQK